MCVYRWKAKDSCADVLSRDVGYVVPVVSAPVVVGEVVGSRSVPLPSDNGAAHWRQ